MSMRIEYTEQPLENVLAYWWKDYEVGKGETLFKVEPFVDVAKGKVIFRLYIDSDGKQKDK